ncbi:MAG: DUF2892 domain-containing protein [Nitrospirota bacterium]|nr:DUF2892 domain-containing protein [Nitrospirota bacterium]
MLRNIGGTEKGIRLVLGGILVVCAFFLDLPTWGATIFSVVGMVALLTGFVGSCPAWTLLGINTGRVKSTT